MTRPSRKPGLLPNLLLAALFITAQAAAALHAFEHDLGVPQGKVCTTCATASQLAGACVDTQAVHDLEPACCSFAYALNGNFHSIRAVVVRQRGPPAPL